MQPLRTSLLFLLFLLALSGCGNPPAIRIAPEVDLNKFMGNWYVIANIPTFIETEAHNAMESYHLNEDGSVATTFTFSEGSFEGEQKSYHPTGYILDNTTNAVWGMQFLWPFTTDYRIVFVDENYQQTIIGRVARDYLWIMARTPHISDEEYQGLVNIVAEEGYDVTQIQKVPQNWSTGPLKDGK